MAYKLTLDPADTAFSQWIRLRDRECVRCREAGRYSPVRLNDQGYPVSHQASHFKGRRKEGTRFEPYNVDTLCGGCHTYFTSQPDEHYLWQVQRKGQAMVDKLILQANTYHNKDRTMELLYWKQQLKADFNLG